METLEEAFDNALEAIDHTILKTNFWAKVVQTQLSSEQVKVLNRMFDGDFDQGISTTQYHKVVKVSKPTALRHLANMVELGCLVKSEAAGRSTRYKLVLGLSSGSIKAS